jgi:dihydrofolate reductase
MPPVTRPAFTLTVVTSADGFIAPGPDEPPHLWASPEEQALFFADIEAADWAVMGRRTHAVADRPDRYRIVFSAAAGAGEWRRPTQLWIDPARVGPADLPGLVEHVRTLRAGLILGGTRVHDWFLAHGAVDRVHLTEEPVTFGAGLPLFTGASGPAAATLRRLGFTLRSARDLNAAGTVHSLWTPG